MAGIEMNKMDTNENDNLYDLVQAKKKLPSLSWKQRVIGFLITAGLSDLFAILVSASSITQAFPMIFNFHCFHVILLFFCPLVCTLEPL